MFRKNSYEKFQALDDVSFEVKKGEFFGIIGRNGSGKSTLLKILAGIYEADKGKIHIDGMISPFLELGIGFNPELSGRDNIYLNATVLGLTRKQIDKKFDDIVRFSELERFIDQKLKNYSSGMSVRLAFSVAIHANREILLMDEVLAVGDNNFQVKCLEEFNHYRELGKTVILVSHDTGTIEKYCDRTILLRDGKIKKIGKANEVVGQYIKDNILAEEERLSLDKNKKDLIQEQVISRKENEKTVNNTPVLEKTAVIKGVVLSSKDNVPKKVFKSGEEIKISAHIYCFRQIKNPNIGIIIKNSEGRSIFMTNTDFNQMKTGIFEKGFFTVDFLLMNFLASGSYSVTIAIADSIAILIYDWQDDLANFTVINKYNSGGIVDFDHSIVINKNN